MFYTTSARMAQAYHRTRVASAAAVSLAVGGGSFRDRCGRPVKFPLLRASCPEAPTSLKLVQEPVLAAIRRRNQRGNLPRVRPVTSKFSRCRPEAGGPEAT